MEGNPVIVDKTVPANMLPLPPHHSTGRMASVNSSVVGNTTSTMSTIHNENVAYNDTTSSRPKMGHIFTKDTGFGLNKLSYVGPIVMGFGGKYDLITFLFFYFKMALGSLKLYYSYEVSQHLC